MMAHREQRDYFHELKNKFPKFFTGVNVLEVGSLNINGTIRDFFDDCSYIGIDVARGPGVDIVCQGQAYDAPDEHFDVCASVECFEHNPYWVETFKNMVRMCKSGGLVIMTCATTGRPEHGTISHEPSSSPLTCNLGWDYYRNLTEDDFRFSMDISSMFKQCRFSNHMSNCDLQFWGIKK